MIFKGLARIEQLVPFEVEVDEEAFTEWLEGADPTDEARAEYLRSSPDWWMDLSLEEPSWRHEVSDYGIERVTAHADGSVDRG